MAKKSKIDFDFVRAFKIVDPLLQTLFIVSFFIFFDYKGHKEHASLKLIYYWQLISIITNTFLKFSKKKNWQRYSVLVLTIILHQVGNYYGTAINTGKINEIKFDVFVGLGIQKIPVWETLISIASLVVAIWYFVVCITEIQYLMKKRKKG